MDSRGSTPGSAATRDPAASWKKERDVPISGGGTWTSYTLDPADGLLLLFTSKDGRHMLAVAPKNGYLYDCDRATGKRRYKTAITTIENAAAPLASKGPHFCPGTQGGVEWNGPSCNPETGKIKWRYKAPTPLLSGVTTTAGELVFFFGDMVGHVFALNAANGERLWSHEVHGATGGGIISYEVNGHQRLAVAAGMTSPIWPTPKTTGKIIVFGLKSPSQ